MTRAARTATGLVTEKDHRALLHATVRAGGWAECCRGGS